MNSYSVPGAKHLLHLYTKYFGLPLLSVHLHYMSYVDKLEKIIMFDRVLKSVPEYDKKRDRYPGLE